jgi:outer membrane protein assembly factor BamB
MLKAIGTDELGQGVLSSAGETPCSLLAGTRISRRAIVVLLLAALLLGSALVVEERLGGAAPTPSQTSHAAMLSSVVGSTDLVPLASTRIGAVSRSYWPVRHGVALRARAGGMSVTFSPSDVAVRSSKGTLRLTTIGLRNNRALTRSPPVLPRAVGNAVRYQQGDLTEQFQTGPLGLEQSFTVGHRPGPRAGMLVLGVHASGSLLPSAARGAIVFRDARGSAMVRYGELRAVDASGRVLPTTMRLRHNVIELRVNDSRARYPVRIDPFVEQAQLPGHGYATFGGGNGSIAISADGDSAVVGSWGVNNESGGEAWVFTRSGSTWSAQAQLLPSTGRDEGFGYSVALSADGNTALVSDPLGYGRVYVFVRSGSSWSLQTEEPLMQSGMGGEEEGEAQFGMSVALSADGDTALIGAPRDGPDREDGASWVYTRDGTHWTKQGSVLKASDESTASGREGHFGYSVSLSANGERALIGGDGDDGSNGAAWTFERSGGQWVQRGSKLIAPEEVGEGLFGYAVALSADGNTALIGAPGDSFGAGGAWVFARSGEGWARQGSELIPASDPQAGNFATSVALSADGTTALIGGPWDGSSYEGSAWLFQDAGASWTQSQQLADPEPFREAHFGHSVALSPDAATALIGAPNQRTLLGAVWAFTSPPLGTPAPEASGPAPDSGPDWSSLGGDAARTASVDSPSLEPPLSRLWSDTFSVSPGAKPSKGYVDGEELDEPLNQVVSYPLIGDGMVFVAQADSGWPEYEQLDAYSERTGQLVWSEQPPPGEGGRVYLALDGGRLFVDGTAFGVAALDARTGATLWRRSLTSEAEPMAVGAGVLYYVEGHVGAEVIAVNEVTGRQLWEQFLYSHTDAGPTLGDGNVYLMQGDSSDAEGHSAPNGTALDAKTGEVVWEDVANPIGGGPDCSWTTIFAEGRLWTTECGNSGYGPALGDIVNPTTGASEGHYPAAGENSSVIDGHQQIGLIEGFDCNSSCTPAPTTLSAEDWTTGKTLWSFAGDGKLDSGVIRVNDDVYVGSSSGMLYAVDDRTGAQVWSMQMPDGFNTEYEHGGGISSAGIAAAGNALAVTAGDSLTLLTAGGSLEEGAQPTPALPAPVELVQNEAGGDGGSDTSSISAGSTPTLDVASSGAGDVAASRQEGAIRCSRTGRVRTHALPNDRLQVRFSARCSSSARLTVTVAARRRRAAGREHSTRVSTVTLAQEPAVLRATPTQLKVTLSSAAVRRLFGAQLVVALGRPSSR